MDGRHRRARRIAQHADRVDHGVDAGEVGQPVLRQRGVDEVQRGRAAAAAGDDRVPRAGECVRHGAADEAAGTGEQDAHQRPPRAPPGTVQMPSRQPALRRAARRAARSNSGPISQPGRRYLWRTSTG